MNSISFRNDTQYNSIQKKEKVSGFMPSMFAILGADAVPRIFTPINTYGILPVIKKIGNFDPETTKSIQNKTLELLNSTALSLKGVNIDFIDQIEDTRLTQKDLLNPIEQVKKGCNAFFTPVDLRLPNKEIVKKNTIVAPKNNLLNLLFHEMGHAHNYNMTKLGKFIQKSRPFMLLLSTYIALYGALTRKSEPEDGNELTKAQKSKNFIRNNAGKLSFLCTLPVLFEEAWASAKGQKWAKQVLSPENAKKVFKGNAVAYMSYIITSVSLALACWSAVKIKDKLIEKKEKEQDELNKLMQNA